MRTTTAEIADDLRALELARLDDMLVGLWPTATKGDPRAVLAALKISERRARLLGIDAPSRIAGHEGGPVTFVDLARQAMTERLTDSDVALLADVASSVSS